MEIELQEIRDFVSGVIPFDLLPENELNLLVRKLSIRYLRRGKAISMVNEDSQMLFIIRTGSLSVFSADGAILAELATEEYYSGFCSPGSDDQLKATEDTLVYVIHCDALFDIVKNIPQIQAFIQHSPVQRLSDAVKKSHQKSLQSESLMNTPLASLMISPVVDVNSDVTIHAASRLMTEKNVSSLLVIDSNKLIGIITDRDIRSRCVAKKMSLDVIVKEIMTTDPLHLRSSTLAFDALMLMSKNNIHHLPIVDDEQVSGIISATDLLRHQGKNSVHISRLIYKAKSIETLAEISQTIPELQLQIVNSGGSAEHVGKAVTAVSNALTCRLIEMAEEKLGQSPVSYAWIAAGSQARYEQSSHSDQDNGLIISSEMKKEDEAWFSELADFVCDGLDACGFIYCPGNAMAKNIQWRQTESIWAGYYKKWINTPEPKSLMLSSIFFDIRVVYGDKKLLEKIQKLVIPQTKDNQLFLAHMTANSLQHKTPLGFFRDFVLVDDGEHTDVLDLKHNGIVPIIDLARVYALAEGLKTVNTKARLKKAAGSPSLSVEGSANLQDAFEFISNLKAVHQAEQIRRGEKADNFLSPSSLSPLERAHLKDAFKVVQMMQASLSQRYHAGHM